MSGALVYDGCQIFHPVVLILLLLLGCYRCYELLQGLAAQGDSSSHFGATGIPGGIKFTNLHTRWGFIRSTLFGGRYVRHLRG